MFLAQLPDALDLLFPWGSEVLRDGDDLPLQAFLLKPGPIHSILGLMARVHGRVPLAACGGQLISGSLGVVRCSGKRRSAAANSLARAASICAASKPSMSACFSRVERCSPWRCSSSSAMHASISRDSI
ncbi:MAG: hypothetical protein ACREU8_04455 [Gammaproteobacteria bacterium]